MASFSRGYFVHNRFEYRLVIWIKIKGFIHVFVHQTCGYNLHVRLPMCVKRRSLGRKSNKQYSLLMTSVIKDITNELLLQT
jgi:hypothetical protein